MVIFKPLRPSPWLKFPCISVCLKKTPCPCTAWSAALPRRRDPGLQLSRVVHLWHRSHSGRVSVVIVIILLLSPFTSFWLSASVTPAPLYLQLVCPPCRCAILSYIPPTDAIHDKRFYPRVASGVVCGLCPTKILQQLLESALPVYWQTLTEVAFWSFEVKFPKKFGHIILVSHGFFIFMTF